MKTPSSKFQALEVVGKCFSRRWKFACVAAWMQLVGVVLVQAQINLTSLSSNENFNGMGTSTTASLPTGWKMSAAGASAPTYTAAGNFTAVSQGASSGSPTAGGRYNWGASNTTDRAPGFMTSGSYASPNSLMVAFTNNTSGTITQALVAFSYELYRRNSSALSNAFYASTNGTNWVAYPAGGSGTMPTGSSVYGFPIVTSTVSRTAVTVNNLNVVVGQILYFRWNFDTVGSNSQGPALDDFSVTVQVVAATSPEISIRGTNTALEIATGDTTPQVADGSDFLAVLSDGLVAVTNTFAITNSGTADLTISGVTTASTMGAGADFVILSWPITVSPSTSSNLVIKFDPQAIGLRTAVVTVANNDSDEGTYTFAIQGTGVAPEIAVSGNGQNIADGDVTPSATDGTDFGSVLIGNTFDMTYTITNAGSSTLTLGSVTTSGTHAAEFTVVTPPAGTVAAHNSTAFVLRFAPAGTGTRSADISFSNDDSDETPFNFSVQGSGVSAAPNAVLLGTNLAVIANGDTSPAVADGTDFGKAYIVGGAISHTFTITNSGTASLAISGVTTAGTGAADFRITTPPNGSVAAGAVTTFVVMFDPSVSGVRSATFNIANDDGPHNPYTFDVTGEGTGSFSTITFQGFEGTTNDTWNYTVVSNGTSVYVDGSTNASGAYAMTLHGSASLNADPYVEFDDVELSAYAAVTLQVAFAVAGADTGDNLELDLSYDGGATWSGPGSTTLVYGASNTNLGFSGTGSSTVGANPWYVAIPATAQQVRVRIRFNESANDNSFDRMFFDQVRLIGAGTAPVVSLGGELYLTTETNGTLTIPVSISAAADATVQVALAGTALAGSGNDYTVNSTNIVFSAGGGTTSNVVFTLNDDTIAEGLEDMVLRLVHARGAVVGGPALASVLVQDDDAFSVMSANLTGGTNLVTGTYTYDEAAQRIIQRLRPDVLAIQEWKITNASYRSFVDAILGTNYYYYVEPESDGFPIPNGVISRWPIVLSNEWADSYVGSRDYVQVSIDIPGPRDLHVVSAHFKAGVAEAAARENEARELTNYIATAAFPTNDYLVVAGDFNLTNRTETTFTILTQVVTDVNQPADKDGNINSSLGKVSPFDHVLPNRVLNAEHLPVRLAGYAFTNGMIFDTTQFDEHLLPALVEDSYVTNRAHHAVLKLFNLSTAAVPPTVTTTIASATNLTTATVGGNVAADGGATVTNRGVVWSTSSGPNVPGMQTTNGTGTGSFSATLTNLVSGAAYYYRAFAQNSAGIGYGAEYTLTTPCFAGVVTGLFASATNATDFTAAWSNFDGASGYELDVSTSSTFTAGAVGNYGVEVFTNVDGGTTSSYLTRQWTNNGVAWTATLARIDQTVNGTEALTLQNASGAYLISQPITGGVDEIRLTHQLKFTGADAFDIFVNSIKVATSIVYSASVQTAVVQNIGVAGTFTIMVTNHSGGRVAIDDLTWTNGGLVASFVPGYSNRSVAGTSQSVTGLVSGESYYYRVRATNDYCETVSSATASVATISVASPEIAVLGTNLAEIVSGDTAPTPADGTDFGLVTLTGGTKDHVFTITNSGTASLTISGVTTSGVHAADFAVISAPGGAVAAGATTSFTLRFDPSTTGGRTAVVTVANNDSNESSYTFVVRGDGIISLAEALDTSNITWTTSGTTNSFWFGQTPTNHDGVDAAQSGPITDSQTSRFETVLTGPGTAAFWWQVSSETNYDFLIFRVDGSTQFSNSGVSGWAYTNVTIVGGVHTLRWDYVKDSSISTNADAAWVDEFIYSGGSLFYNFGVGSVGTTNITDAQVLGPVTVLVTFAAADGVNWNGATITGGDISPYLSITSPAGAQAVVPAAFASSGQTDGAALSIMTGVVTLVSTATGANYRVFLTASDGHGALSYATNFIAVMDDDATSPTISAADISYGGVASRYFAITTNSTPATLIDRAGTFANVRYTLTDAELNEANARDLRFAFGARDADSGIARGISGSTNTVMSFSLDSVISGNFTNYSAALSSANYTNARTTNVWSFPSGFFTTAMINTLMASASNSVSITVPDDDNDRANDQTVLYDALVGWLTVVDDDGVAPALTSVRLGGVGGAGGTTAAWSETMGTTGSSGESIATHESNNRFDNVSATMSGSGGSGEGIYNSITSSGYTGASGGYNLRLAGFNQYLQVDGLDVSAYANLTLSFGMRLGSGAADNTDIKSEYSTNGVDWVDLPFSVVADGVNWQLIEPVGAVPSATNLNLRIRRTATGTGGWDFRIDDIVLNSTSPAVTDLTDGQLASGVFFTGLVQDALSGIYGTNTTGVFAPTVSVFNATGALVYGARVAGASTNGGATTATAFSNLVTLAPADIAIGATYTSRVVVWDYDQDRSGDALGTTQAVAFTITDDDTNAPIASGFQLMDGVTNFDLSLGSVVITGLLSDASGIQYGTGPSYALVLDGVGTVAQSNVLYAGVGSAATGTIPAVGLNCGVTYTVRVVAADADLDRSGDSLSVTSLAVVIQTTGVGGPADYPTASNLLVNGTAAAPATTVFDETIHTGGWSLAMSLSHSVGVFTNGASPAFRITNTLGQVIGLTPWSNATVSGQTISFTNTGLPGAALAVVNTGLQYVVWSASNQGACVASIVDRAVIAGGTNVFTVVDDDTVAPVLSGFALGDGSATVSVSLAASGFAITGLVQDAGSGVAFTSQPPYFLFYDVNGSVLASNTCAGGVEGAGTSAMALTNWFSGLNLSCGNSYTVRVFAADTDQDRVGDRMAVTGLVLVVDTEGVSGDAPAAQDLLVNSTPATSATLFDEQMATGGWRMAMVITHSSGSLVTNGPNAPSFVIQNTSGTTVYTSSPLTWSNLTKAGSTYYATNPAMPSALTNAITTGRYSVVWSARSEGLCFGVTNDSTLVSPGTNTFLVADDDTAPPTLFGLNVGGGSATNLCGGSFSCPDPTRTNLVAGDIAIFAINTKTRGLTNNDSFGFVALVDLPSGTQIKFTDNGWKSSTASFRSGEGTITWMATNCVAAGTVVRWIATNNPVVNEGRIVVSDPLFAPNIEGEQILAYQGSASSPNFIYAVNDRLTGLWDVDAVDTHSSALPPGLADGFTAVAVGEFDNVVINTNNLIITGDRTAVLNYIGGQDNWVGSDELVYDLLAFNFTFPNLCSSGGTITDHDIHSGGWTITGLVQDAASGLWVSNGLGLRYVAMNTDGGLVVSNYFATTFTNGSRLSQAFSNQVMAGDYSLIQLGTYTAQIFAADTDADRPFDQAERSTNIPFTVVDDDSDLPQLCYFTINGQTTITNPADLASVVISGQVRDITSGIGFTSAPPTFVVLDGFGATALSGGFANAPAIEGAGLNWTNISTASLNLSGIADCGTYTVRVTVADADDDRPGDRRSTNLFFLISVASGSGATPVASNLLVNATPAGVASLSDAQVSAGGWSLAVSLHHPSGLRIDAPDTPSFVLRNAAVTGVVTQHWTNIVTAGNAMYATNTPMPAVAYSSIDTGYYSVVWSARSQGACFGATNDSPLVGGDTNRFLVYDDDVTAPPAPTALVSQAQAWTNLASVVVTWATNHVTDASGVPGFRYTTNGIYPSAVSDGLFAGFTNRVVLTNLSEGVVTNWIFAYDGDNDRPGDVLMSVATSFVAAIDRTPPAQIAALAAAPGANDGTSEIDLNWTALPDAGNAALSPWYSYMIFYTASNTGPTLADAHLSLANGLASLGTNTTTNLTVGGFTYDTTYRVAMAGVDRAGNIGPLSATQLVTLGSFQVTQGLVRADSRVDIAWIAATGKTYDLIYVDAPNFDDSLTNRWTNLTSVTGSWTYDTGSVSRLPPWELGRTMRFYRASLAGQWSLTNQPSRVASREVYVAKPVELKEGQNFVSTFMVPDTNTVARILGTNLLPAGPSLVDSSSVITFYGAATNGQPNPVQWWLSSVGHWMYSTGGIADSQALPLNEGFSLSLPPGAGSRQLVLVGRVPTSVVVHTIGPGSKAAPVYNILNYNVPRRLKISETGLREAGLVAGRGTDADEVRIMPAGWGSPTNQPKARLYLNASGVWTYYSYSAAEFPGGAPQPPSEYVVEPDEAIIVIRRNEGVLEWTNRLYYSPPGRNMNP